MPANGGVVLVTGAAGSIGRALVQVLVADYVVVTADKDPLPISQHELVAEDAVVDLEDDASVGSAFSRLNHLGSLQHVVAVAGGGDEVELSQPDAATEESSVFMRVVRKNLLTAFITVRHAVPHLRKADGDRSITLVGSINAFGGYGAPGYSAAKAGLSGLVASLAAPLGHDGIRINCLALGTVNTDNLHRLAEARGVRLDLDAIGSRSSLRRVLTPQDVAGSLVAMLTLSGLTGTTIVLDNGQVLIR